MTRGPHALRREVHNARSSSPMPNGAGLLSDCLRDAGADLVSKSKGGLQRTDISRTGLAAEVKLGPNETETLRAELDEKTRSLKTLQRHYESMSALLANEREELANFRRAHADHERECHELQKKADAAAADAAAAQLASSKARATQAETCQVEKKVAEMQEVLKDSRAQVQRLQEALRTEKSAGQATALQLQEARTALGKSQQDMAADGAAAERHRKSLEDLHAKLAMAESQGAKYKNDSAQVEARMKVQQKEREALAADMNAANAKCRLADEKLSMLQLEVQNHRAEAKRLSEQLVAERGKSDAAKQGQDAAEARAHGMLAEAEANTQEARKHGQHEISELQRQVAELKQKYEAEQALVASVRIELSQDAQSRQAAVAGAAAATAREKAAEERLKKLQAHLQTQRDENERIKQQELEKLQEHMTANQRKSAEELQAERDAAIKSLENQLCEHEAGSAKQQEELAAKVGSLASERRRLTDEVARLGEKEREANKRVAELLMRELDFEEAVKAQKHKNVSLETSLTNSEASRKSSEQKLTEERARWEEQLRNESHRAQGLETETELRLREAMAARNESEGALVAARREQEMLRTALAESDKCSRVAQDSLRDVQQERDSLQLAVSTLQEGSEALTSERDMLQKAVAEANERLSTAERDCDGLISAREAVAASAQLELDQASASARAALTAEQESARAALTAEQEAVRKAEALRLLAEETAASRKSATDELSRRVAEQEKRLADAAKLSAELEAARTELVTTRRESVDARDDAKRWGERAAKIESEHGTSCSRLKRAEANLELLRSELEEAQSENQHLRTDLELKEQRLMAKGG